MFRHLSEAGQLFDDDGTWRTDLRVDELRVPEGVRLVIGRRVKRLGDEARRVLTTAAIVGRSFDLELLDALGDAEGESLLGALEEAEAARLILSVSSGRDVRWEFAHGLIRQTLEHGLSLMRRQRAHLRVAEAMERVHGGNVDRYASDVGRHLYAAGAAADPEKTVRFLTLAGEQALAAGAFEEALRQFDDALSMHEEQDPRHTADLRYRKGQALRSLGRGVDAVEEWQAALTACERLGDGDGIARVAYDAAWSASWLGDMRGAQALARRGLESVGDGDPVTRCRLLMVLLMACSAAGDDYQASLDLLTEAEGLAETLDHPKLTAELHQAPLRFHYSYMQLPEAVEVGRRAVAERRERGELYDVCEVYWGLMVSLWYGGRVREALDVSREAETLSARVGHVFTLWVAHAIQTFHCFVTTGDLAESAARARRNIEDAERANNAFGIISRHQLGQVHDAEHRHLGHEHFAAMGHEC